MLRELAYHISFHNTSVFDLFKTKDSILRNSTTEHFNEVKHLNFVIRFAAVSLVKLNTVLSSTLQLFFGDVYKYFISKVKYRRKNG